MAGGLLYCLGMVGLLLGVNDDWAVSQTGRRLSRLNQLAMKSTFSCSEGL